MKRYDCLQIIRGFVKDEDLVVTSLGGLMDEWNSLRPTHGNISLEILGSVMPFSLGLAYALPHRRVVCLDTDGSLFLNTGAMCTLGNQRPQNLCVFVMDNESYECIGGYPTPSAGNVNIAKMAEGAGIEHSRTVRTIEELQKAAADAFSRPELTFTVCKLEKGTTQVPHEQRLLSDGFEDKYHFFRHIEQQEGIVIKPPSVRLMGANVIIKSEG